MYIYFILIVLTINEQIYPTAMNAFIFKKLTQTDFPILFPWFDEPHVRQWWPTPEKGELLSNFLKRIRSNSTFGYIVLLNDIPLGYIQYYYIDQGEKTGAYLPSFESKAIGIDQFIGSPYYIGKGYGTQMIQEFIQYVLTQEPDIRTIIVDPSPENYAAIRCYEKVGFKKVKYIETSYGLSLLMVYEIK
jgi:RimJ/RimL family protein N-acetyltransferase